MLNPRVLFVVLMSCLVFLSNYGAQIVMLLWVCTAALVCIVKKEK